MSRRAVLQALMTLYIWIGMYTGIHADIQFHFYGMPLVTRIVAALLCGLFWPFYWCGY